MEKQCGAVDGLDKRLACSYHLGGSRLKERADVSALLAAVDVVAEIDGPGSDAHASANGVVDCSANAM